jgi:hypothetical protein
LKHFNHKIWVSFEPQTHPKSCKSSEKGQNPEMIFVVVTNLSVLFHTVQYKKRHRCVCKAVNVVNRSKVKKHCERNEIIHLTDPIISFRSVAPFGNQHQTRQKMDNTSECKQSKPEWLNVCIKFRVLCDLQQTIKIHGQCDSARKT